MIPNRDARMNAASPASLPGHRLPAADGWFDTGLVLERTSKAPCSKTQALKQLAAAVTRWGSPWRSS